MSPIAKATKETPAAVRLAYPSLRRAATILAVDPSTLSRRRPPFESIGAEKRIPAGVVIDEAAYFNKRDLNEIAYDLTVVAEEQSPEAVEAIEQEITERLRDRNRAAAGRGEEGAWLEEARRYLPSSLYRQVEQAFEDARSGHGRRLSGPPPR